MNVTARSNPLRIAIADDHPLMRAALAEFPGATADFVAVLDQLESTPPIQLQSQYVREFDLGKRHALHLSYWTDGDTRRRGEVLGNFKKTYRQSDILVDTHGELPDYLPMVLEYAALVDLAAGRELLTRFRASLEMLRFEHPALAGASAHPLGFDLHGFSRFSSCLRLE